MILLRMLTLVFPAVKRCLDQYRRFLQGADGPLARQGLDSIRDKEFHCLGGGVYALLAPGKLRRHVLAFIIAFQTISDYLDNLCDRFGIQSEPVFRQLHTAMLDSLEPGATEHSDYYCLFPSRDDGGYLAMLVDQCREALAALPHYPGCKEYMLKFTRLYIDLQSYKHMERRAGEEKLAAMYAINSSAAPDLYWWEYAAACGSTLGIFALAADGQNPPETWAAYMPWVNGLHIMLDYFIDQDEDLQHGDMNLVSFYGPRKQVERILWFYHLARKAVQSLARARFHTLIVDGLLAMYLSDAKARSPELANPSRQLLAGARLRAGVLGRVAKVLRKGGII